jgi:hypothetical protein
MANSKCRWKCPEDWSEWSEWLAAGLHARNRWRLPVLFVGALFAFGRRTVTTWLRAVGVTDDFRDYYYFLASLGRKTEIIAARLMTLLLRHLPLPDRLLAVIDDTPTKRYGPKVEGADMHHHPAPGPSDQQYLYGHVWVTLSLALRHPLWGALALPLRALLYVRRQTMAKIPRRRNWKFKTKLELAARLIEWLAPIARSAGKTLWVVVDGFYAKRTFVRPAMAAGVTVIGRLRKNAALHDLPTKQRGPGRPRRYGKHRISLAGRAGQKRGWQKIECTMYGKRVTKTYKSFLTTWRPVGGVIRVVLLRETHDWFAFFSTDPEASVQQILEAVADRATIEQDFHDLKEVWGAGQQQVRNIWTNSAVYHLNLWMHTLTELWAWNRKHKQLCDRSDSPWDDPKRRPSHANRRKALRRQVVQNELSIIKATATLPRKIIDLAERLTALAA